MTYSLPFSLRKTTITSVQALFDKCPDPFLVEVVEEGPEGEIDVTTPVWILPDVKFSEYRGDHMDWLVEQAGGDYNNAYPTDMCEEDLEDFLFDGQEIYVITNTNTHNA